VSLSPVAVVERYLRGLEDRKLDGVPFAPDVVFQGPLSTTLTGIDAVMEILEQMLPVIRGIRIQRHITDGDWVATMFELETDFGVVPVCDCFQVVNGELKQIRPFYDPRPIVEGMARQRAQESA
jgi:limonene-1,2-epoxide hydrolase